ncbi:MAG: hypothetical protein R3C13_01510 [Hyphomonas sp.]|uniref:GHMP family kinase ATP-binding protein n=1 Tax=Hyphomonas sp. TaxID=87 RepID=UPI0035294307
MRHSLVRARAPLRLGFGGGGTDVSPYCDEFGGYVLNATINMFANVTISRRTDDQVRLVLAESETVWQGPAVPQLNTDGPHKLLAGVYNRFVRDYNGGEPISLTIVTYADSPPGAGLGSSSGLVVALTEAMRYLLNVPLSRYEIARLAYEIERIDLGLAGGRQDQYAAAFGGVNFMEFYGGERTLMNPLRLESPVQHELESSLVLYFTGVSRESAHIIEQQSDNMRKHNKVSIDALHALKAGATEMKEALLLGQFDRFADVLNQSWEEKKRTAGGISTGDIDKVYSAARKAGAKGGKVSGAGGGGFMMFLCDPARREELMRCLRIFGGLATTSQLTFQGVEAWRLR